MNSNMGSPYGGTFNPTYVAVTGVTATGATTFTATPVGTAAAISFLIRGYIYTKATISGGATPTTDAVTGAAFVPLAASRACIVVLCLDSSGNIKAVQGPTVVLDAAGVYQSAAEFPEIPTTLCPFAFIKCKNGSTGSAWTFGTSNWNATGMTATPVSIGMIPDRPVTS